VGHVEHVVQHADATAHLAEAVEVEAAFSLNGFLDEQGQVDRAQAAAAVGRQRLFGARVGGLDGFAVVQVVVRFMRSRNRMPGSAWS
jgi:hypothetical protein